MKITLKALIGFSLCALLAAPSLASSMETLLGDFKAAEDEAVIFIYRPKFSPPQAFTPMIFINEREVVGASRGRFIRVSLKKPGTYSVKTSWTKNAPNKLTLALGDVAIIKVASSLSIGYAWQASTTASADVQKVDEETIYDISQYSKYNGRVPAWYVDNDFVNIPSYISLDEDAMLVDFNSGWPADQYSVATAIKENRIISPTFLKAMKERLYESKDVDFQDNQRLQGLVEMMRVIKLSSPDGVEFLKQLMNDAKSDHITAYAKNTIARSELIPFYVDNTPESLAKHFPNANTYGKRLVVRQLLRLKIYQNPALDVLQEYITKHLKKAEIERGDLAVLKFSCRYLALSYDQPKETFLQTVMKSAKNKKLKKHAKKALKYAEKRKPI